MLKMTRIVICAGLLAMVAAQTTDATSAKIKLLDQLAAYRDGAPLSDDQTIILIRHLP